MHTVTKSKHKAEMLAYFRKVEQTGEELIVTDNGRPTLRVVPYETKKPPHELFAKERGLVKYKGDILQSTADEWEPE